MVNWIDLKDPIKDVTEVITLCSFLHTVLPPWDWKPKFIEEGLADFPTSQAAFYSIFHNRWYKLLIYVIGYIALNGRSTLWRGIAMKNQGILTPPPVTKSETTTTVVNRTSNSGTGD